MRKVIFSNDCFYHIYNRGVDKRKVFITRNHYIRFIRTLSNLLNTGSASEKAIHDQSLALKTKLSFICYVLMPNHYHFIVKQKTDGGITEFMHKLDTSYTKYFNSNLKRKGRLFEYVFNAKTIESEEQLLHLSRYIHLNPLISGIIDNLNKYKWSSYLDYIGKREGKLCVLNEVLSLISSDTLRVKTKYEKFVLDQIDYAKELHKIKKVSIE